MGSDEPEDGVDEVLLDAGRFEDILDVLADRSRKMSSRLTVPKGFSESTMRL